MVIPAIFRMPGIEQECYSELIIESGKVPRLSITILKGFADVPDILENLSGHDGAHQPISLFKVIFSGRQMSQTITKVSYSVGLVLHGIEIPGLPEFRVNKLFLEMQHLQEWTASSGFVPGAPTAGVGIHYERPITEEFPVEPGLYLKVNLNYSLRSGYREKSIQQHANIIFRSDSGIAFSQCRVLWETWRGLLHFAFLEKVYPTSISAQINGQGIPMGEMFIPHDIRLYSSIVHDDAQSEIHESRWVFQFPLVKDGFGEFFAKWLRICRQFEEPLNDYYSTVYHAQPASIAFLNLTQALEAFQGIKHNRIADQDFIGKIRALQDAHRSELNQVIAFPNDFPEIVRDNRNWYTHHNPRWRADNRVVEGSALFHLNQKLAVLFQICILKEMEISNPRFKVLSKQLAFRFVDFD